MADLDVRDLERAAALGEPGAREALAALRIRTGLARCLKCGSMDHQTPIGLECRGPARYAPDRQDMTRTEWTPAEPPLGRFISWVDARTGEAFVRWPARATPHPIVGPLADAELLELATKPHDYGEEPGICEACRVACAAAGVDRKRCGGSRAATWADRFRPYVALAGIAAGPCASVRELRRALRFYRPHEAAQTSWGRKVWGRLVGELHPSLSRDPRYRPADDGDAGSLFAALRVAHPLLELPQPEATDGVP